jgi:hypothetical protein
MGSLASSGKGATSLGKRSLANSVSKAHLLRSEGDMMGGRKGLEVDGRRGFLGCHGGCATASFIAGPAVGGKWLARWTIGGKHWW